MAEWSPQKDGVAFLPVPLPAASTLFEAIDRCQGGHTLTQWTLFKSVSFGCAVCGKTFPHCDRMYSCSRCNLDVCYDCEPKAAAGTAPPKAMTLHVAALLAQEAAVRRGAAAEVLPPSRARGTVPGESRAPAGQKLEDLLLELFSVEEAAQKRLAEIDLIAGSGAAGSASAASGGAASGGAGAATAERDGVDFAVACKRIAEVLREQEASEARERASGREQLRSPKLASAFMAAQPDALSDSTQRLQEAGRERASAEAALERKAQDDQAVQRESMDDGGRWVSQHAHQGSPAKTAPAAASSPSPAREASREEAARGEHECRATASNARGGHSAAGRQDAPANGQEASDGFHPRRSAGWEEQRAERVEKKHLENEALQALRGQEALLSRVSEVERERAQAVSEAHDLRCRLGEETVRSRMEEKVGKYAEDAVRAEMRRWEDYAARCLQTEEHAQRKVSELLQGAIQSRAALEEEAACAFAECKAFLAVRGEAEEASGAVEVTHEALKREMYLAEDERRVAAASAELMAGRLEEQSNSWRAEAVAARKKQEREAGKRRTLEASWRRSEQEAVVNRARAMSESKRGRRGFCLPRRGLSEVDELYEQLQHWASAAQQEEQSASRHAEAEADARQMLIAAHAGIKEEVQAAARASLGAAIVELREERVAEEAEARREAGTAERRASEKAEEARRRREEPVNSTVALCPEVPLAVRVPRFESTHVGLISARIRYSIVVEGPGSTETIERQYSDFRDLHSQLSAKPFAFSLQAPPQDWLFAHFSTSMLERRRRQLESYLAFLCTHSLVLLDATIWQWLGTDEITQVVCRLVVAHSVQWPAEVGRLALRLAAVVGARRGTSADVARCVHPAVLKVLRDVLSDNADAAAQRAACSLLDRLLVGSARARQLFLAQDAGGATALLALASSASQQASPVAEAAKAVVQRVLEAAAACEAATPGGEASAGTRRRAGDGSGGADAGVELGECCVCLDRGRSHALMPCGHLCTCMDCADFLAARGSPCPVCRVSIERAQQIFV